MNTNLPDPTRLPSTTGFDVIGDLHGYADTLRALLAELGYRETDGAYRHPHRRAVFVGDFVDRGPQIRETLRLVRAMTAAGSALAVLGNHEFNALRYHTPGPDGLPLRAHTAEHRRQHEATLRQLAEADPAEWAQCLAWFRGLPLWLDLGGLRVVHAAWCEESVRIVGDRRFDDPAFLRLAGEPGTPEYRAVGRLLCGPELALPAEQHIVCPEGQVRQQIRARWFGWGGDAAVTYRTLAFPPNAVAPAVAVTGADLAELPNYPDSAPPVVFGHYWLPAETRHCQGPNLACVDTSVAHRTGPGRLTAYRWEGESRLRDAHLVSVARV